MYIPVGYSENLCQITSASLKLIWPRASVSFTCLPWNDYASKQKIVQLKQSIGKNILSIGLFFLSKGTRLRVCVCARIREYFIPVMKQINCDIVVDLF